ncbi:uncharacterized protein LOC105846928 [Hydra vulgaris]|uniref:uncharacterized protein LOC105846928 n=1 Tax=Hydra vulgaris TaxID=6087 RepID=UPI001F5ED38F|nr:protein ZINC INDUCED FACILITATOR-LIKE 1 [Hydra vulgaris]
MKIKNILKHTFYGENVTLLPIGICATLYLLILFNGMVTTNLSSYLPQLVKTFNVSEVDTGRYVGLVSSAMSVSRVISSTTWGFICDKYGKKVSLLCAGAGLTMATFMFGFSYNIIWTVVTRSMHGLCMGLIVISKSIISDISDDTNLSIGLSVIVSAMNIGYILGPSMAGFLVFPNEKYPHVFKKDPFFEKCKVFLPNFIIAMGLFISLVITSFLLPKKEKGNLDVETEHISHENIKSVENKDKENKDDNCVDYNGGPSFSEKSWLLKKEKKKISHFKDITFCCNWFKNSKYKRMMQKSFLLSVILYGIFSMTAVGYEDLLPVFAATPEIYNGLSMNTSDIGLLYLLTGVSMIVIQFFAINKFVNRYGVKKVFCTSTLLYSGLVFLLPTTRLIKNRKGLWVGLWITQCLIRSMYTAGLLCINVFINNSVEPEFLGLANGIGLSFASLGRAFGSVIFGQSYSWSMKNLKNQLDFHKTVWFPFNEYFAFALMSVSTLVVLTVGTCLPKSINKKYISPKLNQECEMEKTQKV